MTKETTDLGPIAQGFLNHLTTGLELFDLDFNKFDPFFAVHQDYGKGIIFNQVQIKGRGKYKFKRGENKNLFLISIDEKSIRWPAVKNSGSFPIGYGKKDNNPQEAALLVLSAIVRKMPIYPLPLCETCSKTKAQEIVDGVVEISVEELQAKNND
tara:strand:- start:715 stop:1179 length:465 start_codon:yes stop_codon:yes gene_type:complete